MPPGHLAAAAIRELAGRDKYKPCQASHVRGAIAVLNRPGCVAGIEAVPLFAPLKPTKGWKKRLHRFHVFNPLPPTVSRPTWLWFPNDRSGRTVSGVEAWLLVAGRRGAAAAELPRELATYIVTFLRPAEWHARERVASRQWMRPLARAMAPSARVIVKRRRLPASVKTPSSTS